MWREGAATGFGSTAGLPLVPPVIDIAATPDGGGYWLVAADGGIFSFGDAPFSGSTGGIPLSAPIVAMAPTPGRPGLLAVASDGGVFAFGDAVFAGSTGGSSLNRPIVGMRPPRTARWLLAGGGRRGDLRLPCTFPGRRAASTSHRPCGMAADADGPGTGSWRATVGSSPSGTPPSRFDGGDPLIAPVVGHGGHPVDWGYWLVAADGGVFSFATPFYGAS